MSASALARENERAFPAAPLPVRYRMDETSSAMGNSHLWAKSEIGMARQSGLGQVIKAVAREAARQERLRKQVERERQRHLAYVRREDARIEREEERRERQSARDQIARMKESEKRKAAA